MLLRALVLTVLCSTLPAWANGGSWGPYNSVKAALVTEGYTCEVHGHAQELCQGGSGTPEARLSYHESEEGEFFSGWIHSSVDCRAGNGPEGIERILLSGLTFMGWDCRAIDDYDWSCNSVKRDYRIVIRTMDATDEFPCQLTFRKD